MSAEPIATHKQKDVGSIRTLVAHPAECQRDDLYQKNPGTNLLVVKALENPNHVVWDLVLAERLPQGSPMHAVESFR